MYYILYLSNFLNGYIYKEYHKTFKYLVSILYYIILLLLLLFSTIFLKKIAYIIYTSVFSVLTYLFLIVLK